MNPHRNSIIVLYLLVLLSIISLGIFVRWLYNQSEEVYCQTTSVAELQDAGKYEECLR